MGLQVELIIGEDRRSLAVVAEEAVEKLAWLEYEQRSCIDVGVNVVVALRRVAL
jgi:hypothetical protein